MDESSGRLYFQLQGWTDSRRWLTVGNEDSRPTDPFPDQNRVSAHGVHISHATARSRDGTVVPVTVMMREGHGSDAPSPTILVGYGAYGTSIQPTFSPGRVVWTEQNGILAYAHVRGGGELGRDWHLAAVRENKQNSIDDFIASANMLVHDGYTRPDRLGAFGQSAGGLLVGMALVERPDLFARHT